MKVREKGRFVVTGSLLKKERKKEQRVHFCILDG